MIVLYNYIHTQLYIQIIKYIVHAYLYHSVHAGIITSITLISFLLEYDLMQMSASYPFVPESINVSLNGQNITEILSTYCVITALTCNDANFKLRKTEKSNDLVDITANLTDYVRRASKSHQPEYDNDINITISLANCAGVSNFSAIGEWAYACRL